MNEILREIRVEYEQIQVKNRDEAEEWYKVNVDWAWPGPEIEFITW